MPKLTSPKCHQGVLTLRAGLAALLVAGTPLTSNAISITDNSTEMRYICPGRIYFDPASRARFALRKLFVKPTSFDAVFEVGTTLAPEQRQFETFTEKVVALAYSLDGSPLTTIRPSFVEKNYSISLQFRGLHEGHHRLLVGAVPADDRSTASGSETIEGVLLNQVLTYCIPSE
jgi:hypothetical protein